MKEVREITDFMERVSMDARLGPMHVSLYFAMLYGWLLQGCQGGIVVRASELMPLAKIQSPTSFYRCLRQLNEFGYIDYHPSFGLAERSRVYLPLLEKMGYQWKG